MSEKDFMGRKIKKGNRWTEDEHKAFLKGLDFHGKGNWTNIAKDFLPNRTLTQVASHAQKYFVRLLDANSNSNEGKKLKKSKSVQESHHVPSFVPNYMMKSVPIVMPLTWVYMYQYNDHYASTSISTTTFDRPFSGIPSSCSEAIVHAANVMLLSAEKGGNGFAEMTFNYRSDRRLN
ncbi:hypothetical protein RDI58_026829 [Solanum bulbocastanum]|uniref:Uncharacterized protein n=1 Tax=Solanum bulbocastanum TaxID=147425 RepID=A0AAN8Y3Q0_SOLBU